MKKAIFLCFIVTFIFFLFINAYTQNIEFESHIIDGNTHGARSVYAVDIASDGDIDVLSAGSSGITWHLTEFPFQGGFYV